MSSDRLIHLHTHTHFSTLDGFGPPSKFVEVVREQGADAFALTEHGSIRGCYDLHAACEAKVKDCPSCKEAGKACAKHAVKPIFGVEAYMCRDMNQKGISAEELEALTEGLKGREKNQTIYEEERRRGLLDRNHLTILAESDEGFENLMRLTSLGWTQGFYKRPRFDLKTLFAHNKGLIVLSGCSSSVVSQEALKNEAAAMAVLGPMREVFGDRLYVEVMPHFSDTVKPTTGPLTQIAKKLGMTCVATQDAHYPCSADWEFQEAMLAIRKRDSLLNPQRWKFEKRNFYLMDFEQMVEAFKAQGHASEEEARRYLRQTQEVAERCNAKLPLGRAPILPIPNLPAGETDERAYLERRIWEGFRRYITASRIRATAPILGLSTSEMIQRYKERVHIELAEIRRRGIERYFLMVTELYDWCREMGIPLGPGRGSVGGCLIAFLLGITEIDSLEHKLLFTRFLAPGRKDLPDIDCLPPSTQVLTPEGEQPIFTIKPGAFVMTRKGWRRVQAVHARPHVGTVVKLTIRRADGSQKVLTCTPRHGIIQSQNLHGEVSGEHAIRCLPGSRCWTATEALSDLQGDLLAPEPGAEDVQPELRAYSSGRPRVFGGESGASSRPGGDELPVGVGSRLRAVVSERRALGALRADEVPTSRWTDLSARLLRGGVAELRRAERMGSPITTAGGDNSVRRADGSFYLHDLPEDLYAGSGSVSEISRARNVRIADENEVAELQDGREDLRGLLDALHGPSEAAYRALQQILCAAGEEGQGTFGVSERQDRTSMSHLWNDRLPLQERGEPDLLLQSLLREIPTRLEEAEIVSVEEVPYDGIVMNLSVDDCHEYVVNGVLTKNCDFSDEHRDIVIQHLVERYGMENVARIGTIATLKGRGALRDVSRILLIGESEFDPVAKLIQEVMGEDRPDSTYAEAVRLAHDRAAEEYKDPEWQCVRDFHDKYPYVLHLVKHLEGIVRGSTNTETEEADKIGGMHAAGVVIADRPLIDLAPLETRETKPKGAPRKQTVTVTGLTMDGVAKFGLVKLDVLGVKNILMVHNTLVWVQQYRRDKLYAPLPDSDDIRDFIASLREIPLNDPHALNAFTAGLFSGIFQFDTYSMRRLCEGVEFRSFADVAAMVAVVRPGTSRSDLGAQYLQNRKSGVIPHVHPIYDEICAETYGVPVYQEQFTQIFERLGGYTAQEADGLRKVCAKKHGKVAVMAEEEKFVAGCEANGFPPPRAKKLLEDLANFGQYSFNMAHSVAYGLTAYRQMWLKVRYRPEFFAAVLYSDPEAIEDEKFHAELRTFGIKVGDVDVNLSSHRWAPSPDGRILSPLTALKGLGDSASEAIIESRPYLSVEDFCSRVRRRGCNVGVAKALRKAGGFLSLDGLDTLTEEELERIWEATKPKAAKKPAAKRKKKGEPENPVVAIEEFPAAGNLEAAQHEVGGMKEEVEAF